MSDALISASEFFDGAAGSLIWLVCAFAAWWLMFHAPMGRRVFRHRVSIAAPPEKVWSALLLEPSPPGGWAGVLQIETQQFIDGPPLRQEAVFRYPHQPGPAKILLSRVIGLEPAKRLETETESLDGAAFAPADKARAILSFAEEDGGTRLEQEINSRVKGIYGHIATARFYERYYDHLRAHCEGSTPPAPRSLVARSSAVWLGFAAVVASAITLGWNISAPVWLIVGVAVCLEFAILIHEIGHYLAMRAFGHRDASIVLIPFFGGATLGARPMSSRYEAAMVALAGPGFSALFVLAAAPVAARGCDLLRMDVGRLDALAVFSADLVGPTVGLVVLVLLVLMIPLNLINLAPVGMFDGGKVVGAVAHSRAQRAALITAMVAALGYSTLQWGTAGEFGNMAALLVAMWVYQLESRQASEPRQAPMSRRQAAMTLAALAVTLAVYAEASRALLPDFAMALRSGMDAADGDWATSSREESESHTAAP
jgi:Zn-dependent protease